MARRSTLNLLKDRTVGCNCQTCTVVATNCMYTSALQETVYIVVQATKVCYSFCLQHYTVTWTILLLLIVVINFVQSILCTF